MVIFSLGERRSLECISIQLRVMIAPHHSPSTHTYIVYASSCPQLQAPYPCSCVELNKCLLKALIKGNTQPIKKYSTNTSPKSLVT